MSDELQKLFSTLFQAHPWHGVSPGDPADVVQAFIGAPEERLEALARLLGRSA